MRLLQRRGLAVQDHEEELAQIEARDTGTPITTALHDIKVLARYFACHGGAADKLHGQTIPFVAGHRVSLLREPLGVTAHSIPWNDRAQMLGRTLAPAPAMGNATALKPAEDTSLAALRFAEIATAAGLPEGALNIVTVLDEEAAAAPAAHPRIDFISSAREEVLGPVLAVLSFGGEADAVRRANDTDHGLLPAVWTENAGRI